MIAGGELAPLWLRGILRENRISTLTATSSRHRDRSVESQILRDEMGSLGAAEIAAWKGFLSSPTQGLHCLGYRDTCAYGK